jgi:actin
LEKRDLWLLRYYADQVLLVSISSSSYNVAAGSEVPGILQQVNDSICQTSQREDLYGNVVLAGGTTMLEGLGDRIKSYLKETASAEIKITAQADRKYAAWIGGTLLASLSTFKEMQVTNDEYQEWGPSLIHRRCGAFR